MFMYAFKQTPHHNFIRILCKHRPTQYRVNKNRHEAGAVLPTPLVLIRTHNFAYKRKVNKVLQVLYE